jgi:hypothetical protein
MSGREEQLMQRGLALDKIELLRDNRLAIGKSESRAIQQRGDLWTI